MNSSLSRKDDMWFFTWMPCFSASWMITFESIPSSFASW
jgi:hypothetical protein